MKVLIFLMSLLLCIQTWATDDIPNPTLKFGISHYKNGNDQYIALHFENHPKWHTYWKNPGDAGLPIKNKFSVNNTEQVFQEMNWPAPKRYIEPGDMWAYGYEGPYTLFYKVSPAELTKLQGKTIDLKSTWLICKHICIPGQAEVSFKISSDALNVVSGNNNLSYDQIVINERFNNLPKEDKFPEYLDLKLIKAKEDNTLILQYQVSGINDIQMLKDTNLLYLFPLTPFDFKHESITQGEDHIKGLTPILWDGEYQSPVIEFPTDGKFQKPYTLKFLFTDPISQKTTLLEKTFASFEIQKENQLSTQSIAQSPSDTGAGILGATTAVINAQNESNSFFYYILVAFIGGLILNIMPCVLPVISIKLFGLVKYKNESHANVLKHNLFYTIGILFTFGVLASIVLFFKSIGSQVGWGFQLQSPIFISIMIIGLFIFALNLFGLFEFKTPGGSKLGNIQTDDSFVGDFMSGVLATVLSTPCSAPFLGTALTFAFGSQTHEIYLIFMSIGLGLAFPFILTAIYPKLVSFIPKPGNWMNTVKKVLGVSLLLTVVWLADVYNALVDGSNQLMKLAVILIFVFAGFLIARKKERWISGICFLFVIGLFINLSSTKIVSQTDKISPLVLEKQSKGLDWMPWSEKAMSDHQTNKELVFIDFTAKWCFTCKVNEKLVLETNDFKTLVKEKNVKLLLADWTKRDEVIGSFLRKNNMVGVPAYFIQKSDGTLVNLGETISIARIKEYLD